MEIIPTQDPIPPIGQPAEEKKSTHPPKSHKDQKNVQVSQHQTEVPGIHSLFLVVDISVGLITSYLARNVYPISHILLI